MADAHTASVGLMDRWGSIGALALRLGWPRWGTQGGGDVASSEQGCMPHLQASQQ